MAKQSRRHIVADEVIIQDSIEYRVGGYVRLSVDKKDRKTESIENQKGVIEAYIQNHNGNVERKFSLNLVMFYEDKGATGTDFERFGFESMLNDIKIGKINCIIVKDFSRFGRDYIEALDYLENIFPFLDVRFISISDNYDSMSHDAASRNFEVRLKNLVNDMYAKDGSKKISDVKRMSQNKGSFIGSKCPYGYCSEWKDNIRTLIPDPDAVPIVKYLYAQYNNGASINDLLDYLFENRINRPKEWLSTGRVYALPDEEVYRWKRSTVQDLLRSAIYAGHMVQGKFEQRLYEGQKDRKKIDKHDWIIVENTHEAMVSENDYVKASERVASEINPNYATSGMKNKPIRKNEVYENVFSDVMFCGDCQKRMGASYYQGRIQDIRKYRYYCRNTYYKDHRHCPQKSISEEKLTEILRVIIRDTLKKHGITGKKLVDTNCSVSAEFERVFWQDKKELENQKEKSSTEVENAYFAMKRGKFTLSEYEKIKSKADSKNKEIELKLSRLETNFKNFCKKEEGQNKLLRGLVKANAAKRLNKELVNAIVDSIYVYNEDRIVINLKFQEDESICWNKNCL